MFLWLQRFLVVREPPSVNVAIDVHRGPAVTLNKPFLWDNRFTVSVRYDPTAEYVPARCCATSSLTIVDVLCCWRSALPGLQQMTLQ